MAFTASELAVMSMAGTKDKGVRQWSYVNSAGDNFATTANFFLPAFVITDLPVTAQSAGPACQVGDVIYVMTQGSTPATNYAGFWRISTVTVASNQVTAVAVAALHAAP